jgi:two-component system chemotaxis response regulator CheB
VVNRDVVVVGASAGGVVALRALVAGLPGDLPATVLVVLHLPAGSSSALPAILDRAGRLPVSVATHGAPLRHGQVYTAPADRHLLVADDALALSNGPTENGHRPAVNALFRSAAKAFGPRCVGVVLSGALDDGAAGLGAIAARGGATVVQAAEDAICPGMPKAALREVPDCQVLPVREMGSVLAELVRREPGSRRVAVDAEPAERGERQAGSEPERIGTPSGFSCPDCRGALLASRDARRYRCRTGHTWTDEALLEQKNDGLERALRTALRTLDEKTSLANRMRTSAVERQNTMLAERYENAAKESEQAAVTLRSFLGSCQRPDFRQGQRGA